MTETRQTCTKNSCFRAVKSRCGAGTEGRPVKENCNGRGLIVFFTQSSAGVGLRFGLAERERLKQKWKRVNLPQGRLEE